MFGNIGVGELMLIMLVALLVFGPNKLPEVAKNLGKFIRGFQRETSAALSELKEGLGPVKAGIFDEPDVAASVDPDGPQAGVAAIGARAPGSSRPPKTAPRRKTSARASGAPRKTAGASRRPASPSRKPAVAARRSPSSQARKPSSTRGRAPSSSKATRRKK